MLPRGINRRVGKAMHVYNMLSAEDRVLVAVSGGADSLVLAWILLAWLRKAPISYHIHAIHIDMDPEDGREGKAARAVQEQLGKIGIYCTVVPTLWQPPEVSEENAKLLSGNSEKDICYTCAKYRRKQLFEFARHGSFNKLALGHHRDDIIETFFLNICYSGNISTMVPRQDLFQGRLALIRPLAYLDKDEIFDIANQLGISPVKTNCPLSEQTKRLEVRRMLSDIYSRIPESKMRIFSSLSNVREGYLLKSAGKGEKKSR